MDQARKEEIERHLNDARNLMRDMLKQCQAENLNPAAVAQVLGENAIMLMIRTYGPDAGSQFGRDLARETERMADHFRAQASSPQA